MSIRLRGSIYVVDIVTPSGKRIRQSTGTSDRRQALEYHDALKHQLWRTDKLGDRPVKSWDDACLKWLKEKGHKRSIKDDAAKIVALKTFRGILLKDFNRNFIMAAIDKLEVSHATKNRYLALIRSILNKCAGEWDWIEKAPVVTMYKEDNKRIRWLTKTEADRLIKAAPDWVKDMIIFSFMTGLRQANVFDLTWEQVDLTRKVAWVHPDQAKAGRAIGVPLNEAAFECILRNRGNHKSYIFTNSAGQHVTGINSKTWSAILNKAEITDFRWHDMRHTWASWLVQAGTPLMTLKELGGWESITMVQRYAHLNAEHLHSYAKAINFDLFEPKQNLLCKKHGTNMSHSTNLEVIDIEKSKEHGRKKTA